MMVRRYLGVCGLVGLVASTVAGCGSDDAASVASSSVDASMDSPSGAETGSGKDSGSDSRTQPHDASMMDSGDVVDSGNPTDSSNADSGNPTDSGNTDSGNPPEAGGSDASDGGSLSVDGGDASVTDGGDAGISAAGCATVVAGNYMVTSQGHVFRTNGNPMSSAWTAVTVAGGADLDHVVSVAHTPSFACALRDDHTVWCWAETSSASQGGAPTSGQLGDGTTVWPTTAFVATQVQTGAGPTYLTGITSLTTDGENFYGRPFCAVDTAGKVWCWGQTHPSGGGNTFLINNAAPGASSQPYAVAILKSSTPGDYLTGVAQVGAGSNQICIVLTTGQVECWGSNTYGGLGTATADGGSTNDSDYPMPVVGLPSSPGATQISVGNGTVCVIIGGEVYCWGSSGYNATGTGLAPAINCSGIGHYCDPPGSPVVQLAADGGVGGPLTGAKYVYFGYSFGCAITNSNALYCWGAGPSSNAAGAIPLPLTAGGTATNVTHVSSYNDEDWAHVDFSLSDGTYYTDTTNHSVITCQ